MKITNKMFKDKAILITGGSSGIGKITAFMFAKEGAKVAITYKSNKEGADEVVNEIKKSGGKAIHVKADLINDAEAKNVVDVVIKEFGKIDVLVNNAGRYIEGDEWSGASEVWLKSLEQNLVSMMSVSKYVAELFIKQKSGVIISISSRHGINGHPDAFAYSAAKAGVINITQSYAELLHPFGRANSVSPWETDAGYWLTAPKEERQAALEKRPNHKLVDPKTVAQKIVFLASDEAKDINGQNFPVVE